MAEWIAKPIGNNGGVLIDSSGADAVTIISLPQSHIGTRHVYISLGGAYAVLLSVDGGVTFPYHIPGAVGGFPTLLTLNFTHISGNIKAKRYGSSNFTALWVTIT